jgi:photosystem II stability/assembly factor-like uncharacterized protein
MPRLRSLAVLVFLLIAVSSAVAGISERTDAPVSLVRVAKSQIELSLSGLLDAEQLGFLKVAGRMEEWILLYVTPAGVATLESAGVEYFLALADVGGAELYLVPKVKGIERSSIEDNADVVDESRSHLLVRVDPARAFHIHLLPYKKRLLSPSEPGLPLVLPEVQMKRQPEQPLSYSPTIQTMVDAVSQSSLYSRLSDLSGENTVTIGGETYTIFTRYSPNSMCRRSGHWLREQFEDLGMETEYHYFNFRAALKAIVFPENQTEGWAVGKHMLVLHTGDGGDTWYEQHWGDEGTVQDIHMWDGLHGCVVGNNGIIMVTDDGQTWQRVTSPTSNDLMSVAYIDSLTVFCCGYGGKILRSVDGGYSWSTVSSPTGRDLLGMCFVNSTIGWAVGESGRIIKTENGGSSWSIMSSPVSVHLTDVTFQGETSGWISGESGRILRTVNGETWSEVSTPVSSHLQSVFFLNGSMGWACGNEGAIIKSFDGGASWVDLSLTSAVDMGDILFTSPNDGWVTGLAFLRRTNNGGLDWEDRRGGISSGDINVVATLPGTLRPDDIYIICGHYDNTSQTPNTYAPGADDNGTGTIATLEAARVLRDYEFEGTLKFVCFSREEQGLVGSHFYAMDAYERGDNIVAALNFDMIGYEDIDPEDVDIVCNTPSQWLGNEYQDAAALYVPGLSIDRGTATYVGSDNSSFWDYGFSSLLGIEDFGLNNPYYHRTTDRVSTLDFDFYTDVVRGAVATLAELAVIDSVSSSVTGIFEPGRFKVSPNPGRGEITIEMSGATRPVMSIEVYDVEGRLVSELAPSVTSGVAHAVWHGVDSAGNPVGPGIYFVRVSGGQDTAKIVLLK